MSFEGLDHSDFGSLTNTSCLNFSTMDLSNASAALMNSFISNLSDLTYNPNLSQQFWITMFCVTLFGLIINSLFVLTVVKTPFLHTTIYILLASLACSDCIFLITRVDQIVRILFDYPAIINMGRAVSACLTILCFSLSTGLIVLASTERFLAICHPLTHHRLKGTKRIQKSISVVFLISVAFCVAYIPFLFTVKTLCIIWPVGDHPHQIPIINSDKWLEVYYRFFFVSLGVIFLLILVSVSYMYVKILATLRKRQSNTNLQMSAEFKNHIEQVSVMVIVNGSVYFLLTSTFITYPVGVSFSFIDLITLRYWELAAILSYEVNASINPLLYYLTNKRYRCEVKAVFRDCFNPKRAGGGGGIRPPRHFLLYLSRLLFFRAETS